MKSTVLVASLLASLTVAQPHGHGHGHGHHHRRKEHGHNKRDLVVEWVTETVYETVTALVDDSTTQLIMPSTKPATTTSTASTTAGPVGGVFFENPDPSPSPTPSTTVQPPPVVQQPPPPPPPPAPETSTTPTTTATPVETPGAGSGGDGGSSGGSGGSGGSGPSYTGDFTYYALGMGSCGIDDKDKDQDLNIVAVSAQLMNAQSTGNPNTNPLCGKTITIKANGKTIQGLVHDTCPSCAPGDVDGSEKMFKELFGSLDAGRKTIEWWFN